ncbi:transposase [Tunturiibacter gelidiferens]|uniref:transposase n=1 Tax=Tunturiibacter gelidiferens TaxID=3069689 RepID=UPI003D9B246F
MKYAPKDYRPSKSKNVVATVATPKVDLISRPIVRYEVRQLASGCRFFQISSTPPHVERYPVSDQSSQEEGRAPQTSAASPLIESPPALKAYPALDWKLITDLTVRSREEAIEKLRWYGLRWKIETFHKILKSGCKAEEARLRAAERIVNLLAILCLLSWKIFWITMLNRAVPEDAPELAFTLRKSTSSTNSSATPRRQQLWETPSPYIPPNSLGSGATWHAQKTRVVRTYHRFSLRCMVQRAVREQSRSVRYATPRAAQ